MNLSNEEWILICLAILGAALLIAWINVLRNKRCSQISQLARSQTFDYIRQKSNISDILSPHIKAFGQNHSVANHVRGNFNEIDFVIYDCSYRQGSGGHFQFCESTIFKLDVQNQIPAFFIHPEGIMDRFMDIFEHEDIDYSNFPRFSETFVLKAEEPKQIRHYLNDQRIEFIESWDQISIESTGQAVFFYVSNKKQDPEYILSFLENCILFLQLSDIEQT